MALDGDVDFSPEALQLLLDRMKKNTKVGATCGRIKPGGSGKALVKLGTLIHWTMINFSQQT